jgi:Restriction endonuclease
MALNRCYRQEDLMALPHPDEETLLTKEPLEKQLEELGKLLADYAGQPSAEFVSFALGFVVLLGIVASRNLPKQYTPSDLALPEARLAIARLSPSFSFFQKLFDEGIHLEALNWREFEELVADLLLKDGYKVDLGPGRSDGKGNDMQLVKHGDKVVAVIERQWEKAYLTAQQGKQEWVPLFTVSSSQFPVAEIDPATRQVRMCAGQAVTDQLEVVLHDN